MIMTSDPFIPAELEDDLHDLVMDCYKSTELFCKTFMPETFSAPFTNDHRKLFRVLDDPTIQKAAFAAPRDWGKTSIIDGAYPIKRIVYRDAKYIIPISASGSAAIEYSENVKSELLDNPELTKVFGSIKSDTYREGPFSTQVWVTATGIKIFPRGAGQQVRGRQFRSGRKIERPDLIIVDDIEDDESVENEELRKKLKKWFFSAVMNSVDFGSKNWKVIVIGTILHEDSLLANLMDKRRYPDWHTDTFELCDENLKSKWPERFSDEVIKDKHDGLKRDGLLDVFYREYRNIAISIEDRGIKPEYFHDYSRSEADLNNDPNVETVVLADLARTMREGNSKTALVAVGVDIINNVWYVRDVVEGIMSPYDTINEMLEMAFRTNALVLAPEVTGLKEYVTFPLKNEMAKRGRYYTVIEVSPHEKKTGPKRSAGLIPHYRTGSIKHNPSCCTRLEELLLMWPRPSSWDIIDALSGIVYVLDEGERFFSPPINAKQLEDEYKELEEDYDAPLEYVEMI